MIIGRLPTPPPSLSLLCINLRLRNLSYSLGNEGIFLGPGQIDPHIGVMVKTPKPSKMVILGLKNDSFGLEDLDLAQGDDTYKYFEYL